MTGNFETGGDAAALIDLEHRLADWRPDQVGTLMFLQRGGQVLLIRKRRGHGAGRINGPGGKLEAGETPLDCVLRETAEEVGVYPLAPRLGAVFRFIDQQDADWLGYVYLAAEFTGTPRTTAEAVPAWYPMHSLPFSEMWEDDRYWLPRVLAGERLEGDFLFRSQRLVAHRFRALGSENPFTVPSAR